MPARKVVSKMNSWHLELSSRSETERLGQAIGRAAQGGEVLALIGELGAGKTALVQGVAAGLDAPRYGVSSPTFVLVHEYRGKRPLIHVDLYRLRTESEAANIGLEDYFTNRSVVAIEWADRVPGLLPADRLEIQLLHKDLNARTARVTACGPRSLALLRNVTETWQVSSPHRRHRAKAPHRKMSTS